MLHSHHSRTVMGHESQFTVTIIHNHQIHGRSHGIVHALDVRVCVVVALIHGSVNVHACVLLGVGLVLSAPVLACGPVSRTTVLSS